MANTTKIKAYYEDQVKMYKVRVKRAEKNIETQKQFLEMGLEEIDPMYEEVLKCEKEVLALFEKKLKESK